ncbi:MAG: hypothetical protein F4X66_03720 [Chloroflexi bacterium]|nr:hypothetical protein [Chloroflexota bacterium]MYE41356.1 hypothetical protein [Chloroflexota bacterium]
MAGRGFHWCATLRAGQFDSLSLEDRRRTPHGLRQELSDHEVQAAEYLRWKTLRIGNPSRSAVPEGYGLFITCDQSIRFQQNQLSQPVTVLNITANGSGAIRTKIPRMRKAIDMAPQDENNLLRLQPPHSLPGGFGTARLIRMSADPGILNDPVPS